jgi:hypothetical protein
MRTPVIVNRLGSAEEICLQQNFCSCRVVQPIDSTGVGPALYRICDGNYHAWYQFQ